MVVPVRRVCWAVVAATVGATLGVVLVVMFEVGASGPSFCAPRDGGAMPVCEPRIPASWALLAAPLAGGLVAGGAVVLSGAPARRRGSVPS